LDTHDAERIVRRAERTVTVNRKTSEPEIIGRVTFYKRSRRAPITGPGGEKLRFQVDRERIGYRESLTVFEKWLQDTHRSYQMWLEWVDGDALRGPVRRYLTDKLDAIMVRPGVYFLFAHHDDANNALGELVKHDGAECMYHPIELLDTARQHRRLLRQSVFAPISRRPSRAPADW
jgi:hypothetical protein